MNLVRAGTMFEIPELIPKIVSGGLLNEKMNETLDFKDLNKEP